MADVDFRQKLIDQIRYLETSAREYDDGNRNEAIRIAVAVRVVFHHTASSISLMSHMGSPNIKMLSTCIKYPSKWVAWPCPNLTGWQLGTNPLQFDCIPHLCRMDAKRLLPLSRWWNEEVIHQSGHRKIRRRDITLYAANKDGGAHVDEELPADYQALIDGMGNKATFQPDDGPAVEYALKYAHLAALRQIAYEVLNSPELLRLAGAGT